MNNIINNTLQACSSFLSVGCNSKFWDDAISGAVCASFVALILSCFNVPAAWLGVVWIVATLALYRTFKGVRRYASN